MTAKNHFAVYEHIRPDTGQVFYVGKGSPSRVRHRQRKDNPHHTHIMANLARLGLKMEVSIVAANLPEDSANTMEKMRIMMWRAAGVPIVNLTEGGEGTTGKPEESRKRISKALMGNKHSLGAVKSQETRQLLSEKSKKAQNRPEVKAMKSARHTGKVVSEETRKKLSARVVSDEWKNNIRAAQNSPEVKAKKRAAMLIVANSEEVKAKKRAAMLIIANDPDVRARKSAAMKATLARKRAEKAQAA
jgi:hypothetical protein